MTQGKSQLHNAVVVVQARMGSSRLPGKMMEDLMGQPLLWHILQRAKQVRPDLPVVLATTDKTGDQILAEVAAQCDVSVVRGSENNVLSRFFDALKLCPARWVVRVCGDSPLFDPAFLELCLQRAEDTEADVIKFEGNPESLFQGGEVVSVHALEFSLEQAGDDPLVFEHVTAWAMRHSEKHANDLKTAYVPQVPGMMSGTKLSIDTPYDLQRLRQLYGALYNGKSILDLKLAAQWIQEGGWN